MKQDSLIHVAGHRGLVGSAISRELRHQGFNNLVEKTSSELDLRDQKQVREFFRATKPEYVFLAAAKVGGISANNIYRADFIAENLAIELNVLQAAHESGVKKLLFLGSSCIYPREVPQPMVEEALLTGPLEYTNEPYAIAKIAGIKMAESYNIQYGTDFIAAMPTNMYGPNDNYDLEKSHVLPALIRKMHLARLLSEGKEEEVAADLKCSVEQSRVILNKFGVSAESVEIWGSGKPVRELLHSDDLARACVHIMKNVNFRQLSADKKEIRNTHINIGTGEGISIRDLAELVKKTVGFSGKLEFNTERPDGTMKKVMDISRIKALGWKPEISLADGIARVYRGYCGI